MTWETGQVGNDLGKLLNVLATAVYGNDPKCALRENLQNAHDACLDWMMSGNDAEGVEIHVTIDRDSYPMLDEDRTNPCPSLIIRDSGIGMTKSKVRDFPAKIDVEYVRNFFVGLGNRSVVQTSRELAEEKIGRFGLSLLAGFIVADCIEIRTRKEGHPAVEAVFTADNGFKFREIDSTLEHGTEVRLFLLDHLCKPNSEDRSKYLLDTDTICELVKQYCGLFRFPVFVYGDATAGGGQQVNKVRPPWMKAAPRVSDYRDFLRDRMPEPRDPLAIIPVNIDTTVTDGQRKLPVRARGVVYIPTPRRGEQQVYGQIDLYVRRLFIQADRNRLLPAWACCFCNGLLDTPDLAVTLDRNDVVRRDLVYDEIRKQLACEIIEGLQNLWETKGDNYILLHNYHESRIRDAALLLDNPYQRQLLQQLLRDPFHLDPRKREIEEKTNRPAQPPRSVDYSAREGGVGSSPPQRRPEPSLSRPPAPAASQPPSFTRADSKPPPSTPTAPKPPSPKPEIIRRHTNVDFPERVCVGKAHDLRVQFVPAEMVLATGEVVPISKPHAHDVTMPLRVPEPIKPGEQPPPIRVTVAVATENFEIDGPAVAEIIIPLIGKSSIAVFPLIGSGIGPGRIMVDFSQDNHPVGSIDLLPEIVDADRAESMTSAKGEGELNLSAEQGPPIDVQITVYRHRCSGSEGQLQFILSSDNARLQDLPVFQGEVGRLDLNSSVRTFVETQLRPLAILANDGEATEEQVEKTLRNVGCNLYEQLIPKDLKDLYWTFRERGVRSLMIVSDDPYIPWELLRAFKTEPYEEDDCFWGEAFAMTHWLRPRPPSRQLSLGRVVAMAPGAGQADLAAEAKQTRDIEIVELTFASQPPSIPAHRSPVLPSVAEEINMIRKLEGTSGSRVSVLAGYKSDLENAFERGQFDLLHLACHGDFGGTEAGNASAVLMEDGPYTVAELSPRIADNMRLTRPLIFFNGCQTGRIGFVLTDLDSWAARLVELGCGAFVGTLWLVRDESAVAFATAFYARLSIGLPIGEALQQSRQVVRKQFPNDPTWLAYCCFANPLAKTAATTATPQG